MPLAYNLIVGLGNPTSQYELTRHNAGFWFVDGIARQYGLSFRTDARSQSPVSYTHLTLPTNREV